MNTVSTPALAGALIGRSATSMRRIPSAIIPIIVMPLFFVFGFSNTFKGLTLMPGYPTDNIYNWMVPYACVQTASFGALASSFSLGRDLEDGFYDRLLLSPARIWVVPAASVTWAGMRSAIPLVVTLVAGFIGGMTIPGGFMGIFWLAVAAAGVAAMASLWGMGVTYRVKKQSAGGLVQVGLFVAMFLSIGTVPIDLMEGWLPHVAKYNPITAILTLSRTGFIEPTLQWGDIWPGLIAIFVSSVLLGWYAKRGMKTLIP